MEQSPLFGKIIQESVKSMYVRTTYLFSVFILWELVTMQTLFIV